MFSLLLLLLAAALPAAASRAVIEAHFGYEVVENQRVELEHLRPLLQAAAARAGLQVLEQLPSDPDGWWLIQVVIGWRGTGTDRVLTLTLEVERPAAVGEGPWWSARATLPGYGRPAAAQAFARLLTQADQTWPDLLPDQ